MGLLVRIIEASLKKPAAVLSVVALLAMLGVWVARDIPVDALPDLSDVQVIVRTGFPGNAPQIVEDQVTFPLTTALRAVPGATTVRGFSVFGDSFVYVLFKDGTDPYWARSRVVEALSQIESRLPAGARPALGPDATGVGWIYEYALIDRSGQHDLAQLRALQEWSVRFELQSVEGVAEVASLGGMVKEYQVVVDPDRLRGFGITPAEIKAAVERGNGEAGGSVVELAESEYMVRATGYIGGVEDLRNVPLRLAANGTPTLLSDVAEIRIGPQMRRGLAELNGEGEVAGGIIVMRQGQDVQKTISAVNRRLGELRRSLPQGVEIVETYDRSGLIARAIQNLTGKVLQEFVVVALVCWLFLAHWRSSLVIVAVLPLGILGAFAIMRMQGINANIMSLGGIAIAVGAMVDAAVVMVENVNRRLEGREVPADDRAAIVAGACAEVGPALFASLLIVALSFVPILALEAQEGRLFAPLAYTKTYAMLIAALLSITVVPALIALLVRGPIRSAANSAVNGACAAVYRPVLFFALRNPWTVIAMAGALVVISLWPALRLGTEFMPDMDEGDLLYMPTTQPGISIDAARALLQKTDRLILEVPEVERVFGKAGRAETATDPAPLEMFETIVKLKPRDQWRPGLTPQQLRAELDKKVRLPGLANSWLPPIKSRIDMLSTGMRSMLGIKLVGPDLRTLQEVGARMEGIVKAVPGAASVYSERAAGGRYIQIDPDRLAAARYGLNIDDVHDVIRLAVGGATIGESVAGRERFPINIRYPQQWRDSVEHLRSLPIVNTHGPQIVLGDVAKVTVVDGPAMIRSEDARLATWVYIDLSDVDMDSFVREATDRIERSGVVPAGYSWRWSGQYEHLERAFSRLKLVVPLTLATIVLLLYLTFRRGEHVLFILGALPVALVGGVWLMWMLDYRMSVATTVGFIALGGIAAETGVVMLLYLNNAWDARRNQVPAPTSADLRDAIIEGALIRLRPKLMTVLTIVGGLAPIMVGYGAGSEVMKRIAAPMLGGMISATLLTLIVIPALYWLRHGRSLTNTEQPVDINQ